MNKNFKCKHTEKLFNGDFVKQFSGVDKHEQRRLRLLNEANVLEVMEASLVIASKN